MATTQMEPPQTVPEEAVEGLEALSKTFHWNQRKALSHLLIMEEHLKELSEEDIPNAWCAVKHYLLALDHHVEEAIGHAERLGIPSKPYRDFRSELLELNAYPAPRFDPKDLLKLRTKWRIIISDPTLVDDCPLCSADVDPATLKKLKGNRHTPKLSYLGEEVMKLEADYTHRLHKLIAGGRKAAPFQLITCDGDPTSRATATVNEKGEPFITYCAGGVNAHTALHEDDHFRRHQEGNCDLKHGNCPERLAEESALDTLSISSGLNTHLPGGQSGKVKMVSKYEVIGIYGASIVAKGISKFLPALDAQLTPTAVNVWEKASFWATVALGLGPALLVLVGKKKNLFGKKFQLPLMVASAHFASDLLDFAEDQMAIAPTTAMSLRGRRAAALPGRTPNLGGAGKVATF